MLLPPDVSQDTKQQTRARQRHSRQATQSEYVTQDVSLDEILKNGQRTPKRR